MPASKRARACDACHSIKIKCELGSTNGSPPCERCSRLGKDCLVSVPTRNKDRIAELEGKLEALTKLLELQQLRGSEVDSESSSQRIQSDAGTETKVATEKTTKKRRLEAVSPDGVPSTKVDEASVRLDIDHLVPRSIQKQCFDRYRNKLEPAFPIASLAAARDYDTLRDSYPLLLQVIVFSSGQGILETDTHDLVTEYVMEFFTPEKVTDHKNSLEIVQALVLATFWYRPPRNYLPMSMNQLARLSVTVAEDLGINHANYSFSLKSSIVGNQVNAGDAWRTWSSCYLLSATLGLCMRIPTLVNWSAEDNDKLHSLEYWRDGLPSDSLLCQFVRAERLCEQVASLHGSIKPVSALEVTDLVTVQSFQNLIIDWKAQLPSTAKNPVLESYSHLAQMLLHECVLHTFTNKSSFAAPYLVERLSVTDFPAPLVTQAHIFSINTLRDAAHAFLDMFTSFETSIVTSLPMIILSRTRYAFWVLIKLYIATTARGNTFGAYIDVQSLRLEEYLEKIMEIDNVVAQEQFSFMWEKIRQASVRMVEWISNYKTTYTEVRTPSDFRLPVPESLGFANEDIDWLAFGNADNELHFDSEHFVS